MTHVKCHMIFKIEKVLGSRKSIVYSASSSEGNRKQDVVSGWPELFDGKRHQGISLIKKYFHFFISSPTVGDQPPQVEAQLR